MTTTGGGPVQGRFSDGFTAGVAPVDVLLAGDGLLMAAADGRRWRWPLAMVRRVPEEGSDIGLRLSSAVQPDARLILPDQTLLPDLRRCCPDLEPGSGRRARLRLALAVSGVLALLAGAYFGLPQLAVALAPSIPESWQRELGARAESAIAAVLSPSQSGGQYCAAAPGTIALEQLLARLAGAADLSPAPHIAVIDAGLVNAFALPGNRIVVTRGMIDLAVNANELAGVLSHELGHVRHGDPLAGLIARFEWSALTTLLFGGSSLSSFGETIVLMSYSRTLEARADATGVEILRQANIDSAGFAAIMRRMGERQTAALSYLQSHPQSADRVAAIERLGGAGEAALPDASWTDLKRICTSVVPL